MMTQGIRIPRNQITYYREIGWTYEEIGVHFGVSRQRIHQLATGYVYKHHRSPRYKMYKRHIAGHENPYLECDFCKVDRQNGSTII